MSESNLIHYDVSITPEVPIKLSLKLFYRFVNQYRGDALGGVRPVFDGRKNMFVNKLLPFGDAATFNVELEEGEFKIRIRRAVQDIPNTESNTVIDVTTQYAQNIFTRIPFISDRPTILMGAEIAYLVPESGNNERLSFIALTASVNTKASHYKASIRIQKGYTEIISDLGSMMIELLKAFYRTCGQKPGRILFYRDCVSESHFSKIRNNEVFAIKAACQALESNYTPSITFFMVQKSHHIFPNFFPDNDDELTLPFEYSQNHVGRFSPNNDDRLSLPYEFDFYLQSHSETFQPTRYCVLHEENDFDATMLQTLSSNLCLSNNLCYIYALVPPAYYAHLLSNKALILHACGSGTGLPKDTD